MKSRESRVESREPEGVLVTRLWLAAHGPEGDTQKNKDMFGGGLSEDNVKLSTDLPEQISGSGLSALDSRLFRRGITVLEVLISIGVVFIGLLGVLAVVPVAMRQVGQGQTADSVSRAGSNALREFHAYGMARADVWRRATPFFPNFPQPGFQPVNWTPGTVNGVWGNPGNDDNVNGVNDIGEAGFPNSDDRRHSFPIPGISYVLDPRFMAEADIGGSIQQLRDDLALRAQFPYTLPTNPSLFRMLRITLPGRFLESNFGFDGAMSAAEANQIFVFEDDLVFTVPDAAENPPQQVFLWDPGVDGEWGLGGVDDDTDGQVDNPEEQGWTGSDDIPLTRQAQGAFSWMATLVPKRYKPGQIDDRYILSIVIFNRRDPVMAMNAVNERVAIIPAVVPGTNPAEAGFSSGGIGGGEVVIVPHRASGNRNQDLDLKSGDWVLLAGQLLSGITTRTEQTFRWYRIISADPRLDADDNILDVVATLEGPDWPVSSLNPANNDTQVIIVKDVVGVFERTIRIETSS